MTTTMKSYAPLINSERRVNIFDGSTANLHDKKSKEQYTPNPDELPIVWTGTTSSTTTTTTEGVLPATGATVPSGDTTTEYIGLDVGDNDAITPTVDPTDPNNLEEISRVNEAPESSAETSTIHNTTHTHTDTLPCGSYHKLTSFGSHSSKNRGVVLRYQYEVVHEDSDDGAQQQQQQQQYWTADSRGEQREDGTEYLDEVILPEIERMIVDDVVVPALFEECGSSSGSSSSSSDGKKRTIGKLSSSGVVGMDMKPDDLPLPQSECTSDDTPKNSTTPSQCHRIEGAMTLYFHETILHRSTVASAVTLQTLNAIKEAMENRSLLPSLPSVSSLTFLDSSFSLSSTTQSGVAEADAPIDSSGSNSGLIAGLTMVFLALGVLMFILTVVVCRNYKDDDPTEQGDMVGVEISVGISLDDSAAREEECKILSSAASNIEPIDRFRDTRRSNYSEYSSDSETHDSVYMSDSESPGYSNNMFYKTNRAGVSHDNGVMADGTDDNEFGLRPVS